jgi:hypothetical protein
MILFPPMRQKLDDCDRAVADSVVIQKSVQSAINPNPIRSTFMFATTSSDELPIYFPQTRFFGARNRAGK